LSTVYRKDKIKAKVKANGITSDQCFKVNSGTRQGCPLSPLIYAVVADLFNATIVKHPQFKGIQTTEGMFVKITAYADDTAIYPSNVRDLAIVNKFITLYSRATGGITNINKCEVVYMGSWRNNPPNSTLNQSQPPNT
jgi:hypothetical protein